MINSEEQACVTHAAKLNGYTCTCTCTCTYIAHEKEHKKIKRTEEKCFWIRLTLVVIF